MATGAKSTCIVDRWLLHMMESEQYRENVAAVEMDVEKPTNVIREFTNEISETLSPYLHRKTHPPVQRPGFSKSSPSILMYSTYERRIWLRE